MFYTRTNHGEKERKATEAGRKVRLTFRWKYDDKGNKYLVEDEKIDCDAEIQSYLEETKIENIIQRASFDPSIAQRLGASLGDGETQDFTGMPGTLAEAQNLMIEVEQTWDKLPREVKQKFDNDVDKFVHGFGTVEWANALGFIQKAVNTEQPKAEEGKVNETENNRKQKEVK